MPITQTLSSNIVVQTLLNTLFTLMSVRHTPFWYKLFNKFDMTTAAVQWYEWNAVDGPPSAKCSEQSSSDNHRRANAIEQRSCRKRYRTNAVKQSCLGNAQWTNAIEKHRRSNVIGHTLYPNVVSTHAIRHALLKKLDMKIVTVQLLWK